MVKDFDVCMQLRILFRGSPQRLSDDFCVYSLAEKVLSDLFGHPHICINVYRYHGALGYVCS